ncbi:hypothetical protein B0H63DRAFT_424745 [Podospora didyma]|uniref:Polyketide synthase n=1 Tax=Podospora didyma TaxID=330526 RepID=A0AAE0P449_9PEZI|nr:hypothetical protein B0H63DRAFT_424745 [Podospora didyma]
MSYTDSGSSVPIAIVGLACRFPGDASSPDELWNVLATGQSAFKSIPQSRMNIQGHYHPVPERADTFNFKGGHFLSGNIGAFDAKFFGIAPNEANAIDPQQRMLLEVVYEAFESAGLSMESMKGSETSVFIGSFINDYEQISMSDPQKTAPDCATGTGMAIMANRISYFFDLHGTSQTINTGCSASLVCIHEAVNSLRSRQADTAIAGGASLILTPNTMMPMTSLHFLSKDGKCFTFDSRANGYGRGEGVGIVILKRLDDAIRDNDTIRAVIRGVASNQDGRTAGITVPNPDAQVRCIKSAYRDAGLGLDETAYVECHGTGTQAGDWRELKAISEAICSHRALDSPVFVGSAKPNIGHLEAAAGVAGMIRAVLIAEKGQIPPHINFEKWNPNIKHEEWRVNVTRDLIKFPSRRLRRISVNCFGFGGTNAHGVIDDARSFLESREGLTGHHNTVDPAIEYSLDSGWDTEYSPLSTRSNSSLSFWESQTQFTDLTIDNTEKPHLFVFSAQHREGLNELAASHAAYLEDHMDDPNLLRDYSYTMYSRRSHLQHKSFIVATSTADLTKRLAGIDPFRDTPSLHSQEVKPACIFCGQGAQWPRMGIELMAFGVFRESIEAADDFMRSLDTDFHLAAKLGKSTDSADINLPEVSQPAITAIQVALVDLLRACHIRPFAVVGHSSGEIAAAYAAGFIGREDAWKLAFYRGQCAASLKHIRGRMLAVGLSKSNANKYAGMASQGSVHVACINSPHLVTLSGDEDAILAIKTELDKGEIFNALVPTETAYHSHHMKAVSQQYLSSISGIKPRTGDGRTTMYSSVYGREVAGPEVDAHYWTANLVSPVEFEQAVTSMMSRQAADQAVPNFLLEVSPHRVWPKALKQILDAAGFEHSPVPYASMLERGKHAIESVLQLLGDLFLHGARVDLDWFFMSDSSCIRPKCLVDLPRYPWDHSKTYWRESHLSRTHRFRQFGQRDFIGAPSEDAILPYEPRWRGHFRVNENPWILDHQVQREILYPAGGMVVMAIEAARQVVHDLIDQPSDILDFEISRFEIKAPMVVPTDDHGLEHCMNAKRISDSFLQGVTTWSYEFAIFSKPIEDSPYQENAEGIFTIRFYGRGADRNGGVGLSSSSIGDGWHEETARMSPFEFYEGLDVIGMNYGPLLRNIFDIGETKKTGQGKECLASIMIPDTKSKMPQQFEFDHIIHPATLDSIFQTVFTLGSRPMVPFYIDKIRVTADIPSDAGTKLVGVAKGYNVGLREACASIGMWHSRASEQGAAENKCVVEVEGLRLMSIVSAGPDGMGFLPSHRNLTSTVIWKEDVCHSDFDNLKEWLDLLGHKNPGVNILHIGENLHMITTVIQALAESDGAPSTTPRLATYTISAKTTKAYDTVLSSSAQRHQPLLTYQHPSDLSSFAMARQFDLVIVESATELSMKEIETFVKPAGFLLAVSDDQQSDSGLSEADHLLSWSVLSRHIFSPVGSQVHAPEVGALQMFCKSGGVQLAGLSGEDIIILQSSSELCISNSVAEFLQRGLSDAGLTASIQTLEWLQQISPKKSSLLVISLLDLYDQGGFVFNMSKEQFGFVKKLLRSSKGLLWTTRGAQMACASPQNAAFLGWSRTVRSEDSHKHIVCLDLQLGAKEEDTAKLIQTIFLSSFTRTAGKTVLRETEYAERDGHFYIPRLSLLEDLNTLIDQGPGQSLQTSMGTFNPNGDALKLEVGHPGRLESLYFSSDLDTSTQLQPDQVRIQIHQTFLFPVDLETVLGKNTMSSIGVDVVGAVVEVGKNVIRFRVGQDVVALAQGSVQNSVVAHESYVQVRPKCFDGPEAKHENQKSSCLLPWSMAALFTAYQSTNGFHIGSSTVVLVHAAAGVLGQAAIALFRHLGAKIIATVSNDEQTRVIKSIFDMEDKFIICDGPELTERVQRLSGELGRNDKHVDLVFDPTGGKHLDNNFSCIANFGRIFQVTTKPGDWDNVQLPRRSFEFVRFDLDAYLNKGLPLGDDFEALFATVTEKSTAAEMLRPFHIYSFGRVSEALKHMEKDPNAGTFILKAEEENVLVGTNPIKHDMVLDANGIYVIVGGFGGLGLRIASWLVEQGAGHVVLASRSAAPTREALRRQLDKLTQSRTTRVRTYQLDICDSEEVAVFTRWLQNMELKVKGVIHAAGVLRDATYQNMTYEDWTIATKVKTIGSWNLHESLPKDLDFFILLSSAAGVIGNRGQANYAAANSFQDSLARHRTLRGMRTVSLDIGPIIGVGMVDQEMMDHLRSIGFFGIRLQDMLLMLERSISGYGSGDNIMPPQVVMGVGTGGLIKQNKVADPFWADTALFAHLNRVDISPCVFENKVGKLDCLVLLRSLKQAATMEEGVETLMGPLIDAMVSIIPNIEAAGIKPHMTPTECHSDSMRGTNLDSWLKRATGVSIGQGINSMPLQKICEEVIRKGGFLTA